jgi:ribosomal protein S18 acetylase RimI-like enzyme
MEVRHAELADLDPLATLWLEGWRDAHEGIVPQELARYRTLPSFRERLEAALPHVRVVGPVGNPIGFCTIEADELNQLYVSAEARGSGAARVLLSDGEHRIAALGIQVAWLACAIGNERAARFYEKSGWHRVGIVTSKLPTPDGIFPLDVWRYEKDLSARAGCPAVGVAHVVLNTDRMEESARFMRIIGMRPIFDGPQVSVYEMRGGTHLILMHKEAITPGDASFDLMVDDVHAAHQRFSSLGLSPSPIEARPAIDHEVFTLREPAGHTITIFSSHASSKPL